MNRSILDKLVSSAGLLIAVVLLAASTGLFYAHNFVHAQVRDQLAAEKISFPTAGSKALLVLPSADQSQVAKYAGQQVVSGAQAEVFADHYIAVHLRGIGGGQTYSELSAASMAHPTDTALAAKVKTMFQGETLRGMLLNAYAFDTMATVANAAAYGALTAGIVLLVLALLGFRHSSRAKAKTRR